MAMLCMVMSCVGGEVAALWNQPEFGFRMGDGVVKCLLSLALSSNCRRRRGEWESWVSAVVGLSLRERFDEKSPGVAVATPYHISGSVGVSGVGSGLVSWRGNGTSVGVGFYDPSGNPHYSLRNQPGSGQRQSLASL